MNRHFIPILAAIALVSVGCTWVKLTHEGSFVRVAEAHEVITCEKLGKTTVSLMDKVAGLDRSAEKVRGELETLARNSAANIGGDTVVAISEIAEGKQAFDVYRCNAANR